MMALMLYLKKYYELILWKTIVISVLLTVFGVLGTLIMHWIESGNWAGISFFGAVFFVPIFMTIVALMLHIPIGIILDMCAPAECIMLVLMKGRCLYYGCCEGRIMHITDSVSFRFPSQVIEMLNALGLIVVLVLLIRKCRYRNQIYATYMIIYGVMRFILNLFRETEPFVWILPAGNLWALVSSVIGSIWIFIVGRRKNAI